MLFLCLYIDSFTVYFTVSHQFSLFWLSTLALPPFINKWTYLCCCNLGCHQLQTFVWGTHIPPHTSESQTYPHCLLQWCLFLVCLPSSCPSSTLHSDATPLLSKLLPNKMSSQVRGHQQRFALPDESHSLLPPASAQSTLRPSDGQPWCNLPQHHRRLGQIIDAPRVRSLPPRHHCTQPRRCIQANNKVHLLATPYQH